MEQLTFDSEIMEFTGEKSCWRARAVTYKRGSWSVLNSSIPRFEKRPVSSSDGKVTNPFFSQIVRLPLQSFETEVPVGFVSPSYGLAEHFDVALHCLKAVAGANGNLDNYTCEIGLSELGEWMNFRVIFPSSSNFTPDDGHSLTQRLECFNSVDGSSRLQLRVSWLRLECLNGLSVGETKEISSIHNGNLDLEQIFEGVSELLADIERQRDVLRKWTELNTSEFQLKQWLNEHVRKAWGVKAAARIYHICISGKDVEFVDPFEKGLPTEKQVVHTKRVPGSPTEAKTYHDVAQALSWVATHRNNAEERHKMQSQIDSLLAHIEKYAYFPENV